MVNSKVVDNSEQVDFPCLMTNDCVVVLFHDKEEGIVVHRLRDYAVRVGSRMTNRNFTIENFQIFNGSVELSNKK